MPESTLSAALRGISLARHGQTAYNATRRFQGLLPVPLNEAGRAQARDLAERAAGVGFAALWCSPLLRARQTAEVVGVRIGLAPTFDARLVETDSGAWTDRLMSEVAAEDPEGIAAFERVDGEFAFPGGESFAAQTERVLAALSDVAAGPLPALVVCHGMVIRLVLIALGEEDRHVANAALIGL